MANDDWDEDEFQGYQIGSIQTLGHYDRPIRRKLYKRPIGYMKDLDKLEPVE